MVQCVPRLGVAPPAASCCTSAWCVYAQCKPSPHPLATRTSPLAFSALFGSNVETGCGHPWTAVGREGGPHPAGHPASAKGAGGSTKGAHEQLSWIAGFACPAHKQALVITQARAHQGVSRLQCPADSRGRLRHATRDPGAVGDSASPHTHTLSRPSTAIFSYARAERAFGCLIVEPLRGLVPEFWMEGFCWEAGVPTH